MLIKIITKKDGSRVGFRESVPEQELQQEKDKL